MRRGRAHQPLVALAGRPAQPVVEVRHRQVPVELGCEATEQVQQDHRVQAAGNRDEDVLPGAQQLPGLDIFAEHNDQVVHLIKLAAAPAQASGLAKGDGNETAHGARV